MPNSLLMKAIAELQNLNSGEVFMVRDLFKGYEWNRIKTSDRLTLGTLFKNHIISNPQLGIGLLDKTASKQQKYIKNN